MDTDEERGSDSDRDPNQAENRPREDMVFPEDFRNLMRRFFGPWTRRR
ncbi:MAG: hypothetical protein WCJ53_12015 [Mycobacteriaceae bacterium]